MTFNMVKNSKEKWEMVKAQVAEVMEELEKSTQKEVIHLKTTHVDHLEPLVSKIGGQPYLPKDEEFAYLKSYKLLAQINCEELPPNHLYPKKGILQFWVSDVWDIEDSKIIYHEEVREHFSSSELSEIYTPIGEIMGQHKCFSLSFEVTTEMMNFTNERLLQMFDELYEKRFGDSSDSNDVNSAFYEWFDKYEEDTFTQHKIGGYPYYIQDEVFPKDKDILLLQIGSEMKDNDWVICIGDVGIISFGISKKDLETLNFKNVFCNVDCY